MSSSQEDLDFPKHHAEAASAIRILNKHFIEVLKRSSDPNFPSMAWDDWLQSWAKRVATDIEMQLGPKEALDWKRSFPSKSEFTHIAHQVGFEAALHQACAPLVALSPGLEMRGGWRTEAGTRGAFSASHIPSAPVANHTGSPESHVELGIIRSDTASISKTPLPSEESNQGAAFSGSWFDVWRDRLLQNKVIAAGTLVVVIVTTLAAFTDALKKPIGALWSISVSPHSAFGSPRLTPNATARLTDEEGLKYDHVAELLEGSHAVAEYRRNNRRVAWSEVYLETQALGGTSANAREYVLSIRLGGECWGLGGGEGVAGPELRVPLQVPPSDHGWMLSIDCTATSHQVADLETDGLPQPVQVWTPNDGVNQVVVNGPSLSKSTPGLTAGLYYIRLLCPPIHRGCLGGTEEIPAEGEARITLTVRLQRLSD